MQLVLDLLSRRVEAELVHSLPVRTFSLVHAFEAAFRSLQSGATTGKVVLLVPQAPPLMSRNDGSALVTGGTGGLGLLTARWLAQQGAQRLALGSRSGVLAPGANAEWEAISATSAEVDVFCLDAAQRLHMQRASSRHLISSVWHAAGVLSDYTLPQQGSYSFCRVFAPKVHGALLFQQSCARSPTFGARCLHRLQHYWAVRVRPIMLPQTPALTHFRHSGESMAESVPAYSGAHGQT